MSTLYEQIGEHETKFVFPNERSTTVCSWLGQKCERDPDYAVGIVSSIYFDTKDWILLDEKLNSTYLKTKVRLRWHSEATSGKVISAAYLEIKNKIGSARKKVRIKTELDTEKISTLALEASIFLQIPQILVENGYALPQQLVPAFQINYLRYRYVDPLTEARLSFDRDINVSRVNNRMLHKRSAAPLKTAVFEIKYAQPDLPQWLHQLTALGGRREAFSKYSACYCNITGEIL